MHYVVEAPAVFFGHSPLQIAATILLPAAVAALVYALLAVATAARRSGRLAAGRSTPVIGPPVTAERRFYRPPSDHLRGDLASRAMPR